MTNQQKSTVELTLADIGNYGKDWLNFMDENHPELVREMEENDTLLLVAQSVDNSAWEYRELLDRQYAELHPRPQHNFEETVAWERTRTFHTDSTVMRERVLLPYTKP